MIIHKEFMEDFVSEEVGLKMAIEDEHHGHTH